MLPAANFCPDAIAGWLAGFAGAGISDSSGVPGCGAGLGIHGRRILGYSFWQRFFSGTSGRHALHAELATSVLASGQLFAVSRAFGGFIRAAGEY